MLQGGGACVQAGGRGREVLQRRKLALGLLVVFGLRTWPAVLAGVLAAGWLAGQAPGETVAHAAGLYSRLLFRKKKENSMLGSATASCYMIMPRSLAHWISIKWSRLIIGMLPTRTERLRLER